MIRYEDFITKMLDQQKGDQVVITATAFSLREKTADGQVGWPFWAAKSILYQTVFDAGPANVPPEITFHPWSTWSPLALDEQADNYFITNVYDEIQLPSSDDSNGPADVSDNDGANSVDVAAGSEDDDEVVSANSDMVVSANSDGDEEEQMTNRRHLLQYGLAASLAGSDPSPATQNLAMLLPGLASSALSSIGVSIDGMRKVRLTWDTPDSNGYVRVIKALMVNGTINLDAAHLTCCTSQVSWTTSCLCGRRRAISWACRCRAGSRRY